MFSSIDPSGEKGHVKSSIPEYRQPLFSDIFADLRENKGFLESSVFWFPTTSRDQISRPGFQYPLPYQESYLPKSHDYANIQEPDQNNLNVSFFTRKYR